MWSGEQWAEMKVAKMVVMLVVWMVAMMVAWMVV